MGPGWGGVAGEAWGGAGSDGEPSLKNLLEFGPFQGGSWLSGEGSTWSSKPVRSGSPRLGRFDSCAAPSRPIGMAERFAPSVTVTVVTGSAASSRSEPHDSVARTGGGSRVATQALEASL